MKIKKGTSRVVLVIPNLGIAIKIPRVQLLVVFRGTARLCLKRDWQMLRIDWSMSATHSAGFRGRLLKGLLDNRSEFAFYRRTHDPFLLPTFFSLFGLFNIQLYGEECGVTRVNLWTQLCGLTDRDVWADSHAFDWPPNFCRRDGKLLILDYASKGAQEVIEKWGSTIVSRFDFTWDWEKEKQRSEPPG